MQLAHAERAAVLFLNAYQTHDGDPTHEQCSKDQQHKRALAGRA